VRYDLSSKNASYSSVQTKGLDFRRSLKNGRTHSASLEMNRLSAAKHSVRFYTSLTSAGCHISLIVLILSRLALIPVMKPGSQASCLL
jgi:hypothetical protein